MRPGPRPAYDEIGVGYSRTRRPDPRIAGQIREALGDSTSVVNVGAGTGSYEPRDRAVVAVEPSVTMLTQRPADSAPAIRGAAESLPFADRAFDAALAILTVHHWSDPSRGLAELRRVAATRIAILTWDQQIFESFWLVRDYLPGIRDVDRPRALPLADIVSALSASRIVPVPVPHNCADGFLGAFWRRPDAYLDPQVRAGISACREISESESRAGLGRLAEDIQSGAWAARHHALLDLDLLDLGYRLVVSSVRPE